MVLAGWTQGPHGPQGPHGADVDPASNAVAGRSSDIRVDDGDSGIPWYFHGIPIRTTLEIYKGLLQ